MRGLLFPLIVIGALTLGACVTDSTGKTCTQPTAKTGDAAFDASNLDQWKSDLQTKTSKTCAEADSAYAARAQQHATASTQTQTPAPTPAATPTRTSTPTEGASPSPSPSPSTSPTEQATQTPAATPTPAPKPQQTVARTPEPTAVPTPTPTPEPTPTPTPSPSPSPSTTLPPNTPPSPPAGTVGVYGKVTDTATGGPVNGICVVLGQPGAFCWAITDSAGNYTINADGLGISSGTTYRLYFYSCVPGTRSFDGRACTSPTPGYAAQETDQFTISGVIRKDWAIHK